MPYSPDWEKSFDKKFEGYWRGRAVPDEIKFFIHSLLQAREEWLRGEIEKAMFEVEDEQIVKTDGHPFCFKPTKCEYNKGLNVGKQKLKTLLRLLTPKN